MGNWNRTGSNTPDSWNYYRIGFKAGIPLGVAANNTATIPLYSGGPTANIAGEYIIRRITMRNSSGAVTAANVSVSTPQAGQITNSQGMAAVTAQFMYQDFTLGTTFINSANATITITVPTTTTALQDPFLYFNVLAAAAANNTVDVCVYGESITP